MSFLWFWRSGVRTGGDIVENLLNFHEFLMAGWIPVGILMLPEGP